MKVLVATSETQGTVEEDYFWTVEGELVYIQSVSCSDPRCGCSRGFAGMSSSRATTTAMVVDRPELSRADVAKALADSLERGGWLAHCDQKQADEMVGELLAMLANITESAPMGSVVRREGDFAYVR
ncbi:MAG: hypothetical protein DHS20C19_03540 [Acidimicrobiales bacterium]|nr:MAG: hypothetical protein DHS20C19_03540 [Acidimicrobiales bacterium]